MPKTSVLTLAAVVAATLGAGLMSSPAVASPTGSAAATTVATTGATAAVGPRDHVLVVNQAGNGDWLPLVRSTRGSGFHVDFASRLPADLTLYGQVWWIGCAERLTPAAESQLVEFDRAGGSLLLTAEIRSCPGANATTKAVADTLIATLGADGLVYGPNSGAVGVVNPRALHDAATRPAVLTGFRANDPGSIDASALPRRNVLVRNAIDRRFAYVTVWDRSDLVGEVGGRIIIVTDINWPTSSPNATDIALTFATFLQGVER